MTYKTIIAKPAHLALITTKYILIIFIIHRFLSFSFLKANFDLTRQDEVKAFLIGSLSDLWVANLFGFLIFVSLIIFHFFISSRKLRWSLSLIVMSIGSIAAFHQPYIEFFHVPFILFHFTYLFDTHFILANYQSAINLRLIVILIISIAVSIKLLKSPNKTTAPLRKLSLFFLIALAGHVCQIRYRIQWHIPQPLQANIFESLFIQWHEQDRVSPLDENEQRMFTEIFANHEDFDLEKILLTPIYMTSNNLNEENQNLEILNSYAQIMSNMQKNNIKPLLLTVLMESFRACDSGTYGGNRKSITPFFDHLASSGILFASAWSTGTVTRGAQEAVLCGYPGSINTSTMRARSELFLTCLPDVTSGFTFWYHGGEGQFDNQLSFWKRHRVDDVLSLKDFPKEISRTGWGVGDESFVKIAFERLKERHNAHQKPYSLGLFLTISNHIPWQIPDDASPEIKNKVGILHPSEITTLYADNALGKLVTLLKEGNLWEHTLLIVVGDHGIYAPPLNGSQASSAEQLTKIAMALSGGITDHTLQLLKKKSITIDTPVSQADIAPFLAYLTNSQNISFFGQNLFQKRRFPVVSDLGNAIFFPEQNKEIPTKDILSANQFLPAEIKPASLYYRGFRLLLEKWSITKTHNQQY